MSKGVDKKQLLRYLEIEKQVNVLETKGHVKELNMVNANIKDIDLTLITVKDNLKELRKKTQKEKQDVDDLSQQIKQMAQDEKLFTEKMSKEKAEYMEALNNEAVCKQQLEGLTKQQEDLKKRASKLQVDVDSLKKLYQERDTLLSDIFGGEYGSDLENKLEAEFDEALEKKNRIEVAKNKWTNGRTLLQHAVKQLGTAVQHWGSLKDEKTKMLKGDPRERYAPTTEVRNQLIAARQNVDSTQRYLGTIKFPYCEPCEMETLGRAINNIYADMTTIERHGHAETCYVVTYKRAAALLQWFDTVINQTITKDLAAIQKQASDLEQKLRAERIKLIRDKIQESGGDMKGLNDAVSDMSSLKGLAEQSQMTEEQEKVYVVQPRGLDDKELPMKQMEIENDIGPCPTPLPLSELAPAPSEQDIFGDISQLKEQHIKHQQEFQKAQDMNKARLEQGLKEKLAARRQKKY